MDIIGGLSAVSAAPKITKDLRELDFSLNNAELKAKFAELYSSLADAKMALSDAKVELQEKQYELNDLKRRIEILELGDHCPKCRTGNLKLVSDEAVRGPAGATGGVRHRSFTSEEHCGFIDKRVHDPHGILRSK